MEQQEFFKKALSDFTYDAASGGAIRHLADLGLTVKQIEQQLSFPTPYPRIQRTVWEHLLSTGVLQKEIPTGCPAAEQVRYVREYDSYGKPSFRRIVLTDSVNPDSAFEKQTPLSAQRPSSPGQKQGPVSFWERHYVPKTDGPLLSFLGSLVSQNGEDCSYVSCDFGIRLSQNKEEFLSVLQTLDSRQQDYILGLPWVACVVYHRLDLRMREITACLFENGDNSFCFYFTKTGQKVVLS